MVARPQVQQNVARSRDGTNAFKSVNVNDLHGFGGDRVVPLFAWTGPPPCSYVVFFRQVVCHALQRHTAPSLHLPLCLKETFLCTLVS